jgi:ubiquinone/menaquinone biosynthesis C-methylase UbiE
MRAPIELIYMGPWQRLVLSSPFTDRNATSRFSAKMLQIYYESVRGCSVLEIGCGQGAVDLIRKSQAKSYVGLDLSFGLISYAKKQFPNTPFIQAQAMPLPFAPQTFDVLVSRYLFHHIPLHLRAELLSEQLRVARREIIIEDVFGFKQGLSSCMHQVYYRIFDASEYRFTLLEWRSLFQQCGLKIIWEFYTGERNLHPRRCIFRLKCATERQ